LKVSSKSLVIAAIIAAIVVPLVLYQPVMATEVNDDSPNAGETMAVKPRPRAGIILRFLKRAEPTVVEGEAVALVKNILVLNVDDEPVRVLLPPTWTTMDGEVIEREALMESIGDETITITGLQASFENPQGVTISFILGYEITTEVGSFYAVLPFNISID
jgi:hypothetical protein